jgi:hypothetical protein
MGVEVTGCQGDGGNDYPQHPDTTSKASNHPITHHLLDAPQTDALDEGALEEEEEGDHW